MDQAVSQNESKADIGQFSFHRESIDTPDGREAILEGLREPQKRLDPKWFYDERGSQLFDKFESNSCSC